MRDLGQIHRVEQRQLQRAAGRQLLNRSCAQSRDPVDAAVLRKIFAHAGAVVLPRSPTSTSRFRPKRSRSFLTWSGIVFGSAVLPSHTSTATGQPAALVSSPKTICGLPLLPSRECPGLANSQCRPSKYVEVRSYNTRPPALRCFWASAASTAG